MFENLFLVGFGLLADAWIGSVIHGLELWIRAQTHDLVNGQWVKRCVR